MTCEGIQESLSAYQAGELDEAKRLEVEAHLADCPECRELFEALRELDAAVVSMPALALDETRAREILEAIHEALDGRDEVPSGEIWTPEDVARFFKVDTEDVYEMAGDLPFFSFGRNLRIRKSELLAWIEEQEEIARRRTLLRVVNARKA